MAGVWEPKRVPICFNVRLEAQFTAFMLVDEDVLRPL